MVMGAYKVPYSSSSTVRLGETVSLIAASVSAWQVLQCTEKVSP